MRGIIRALILVLCYMLYDVVRTLAVRVFRLIKPAKGTETPVTPAPIGVFSREPKRFYLVFLIFFAVVSVYKLQTTLVLNAEDIEVYFAFFIILSALYTALTALFGVKLAVLRIKMKQLDTPPDTTRITSDVRALFTIAGVSFLLLLLTLILKEWVL
ncbi:MAG: hypothetical protein LBH17_00705 [Oscillospiraceae bacterium]|jgi:hypothetical protein|nr:hypothetical protein [Oscillospiraceae bacterium]